MSCRTAANADIEISVDLTNRASPIIWRRAGGDEDEWSCSPFQSADVRDEHDALAKVDLWLETSYG